MGRSAHADRSEPFAAGRLARCAGSAAGGAHEPLDRAEHRRGAGARGARARAVRGRGKQHGVHRGSARRHRYGHRRVLVHYARRRQPAARSGRREFAACRAKRWRAGGQCGRHGSLACGCATAVRAFRRRSRRCRGRCITRPAVDSPRHRIRRDPRSHGPGRQRRVARAAGAGSRGHRAAEGQARTRAERRRAHPLAPRAGARRDRPHRAREARYLAGLPHAVSHAAASQRTRRGGELADRPERLHGRAQDRTGAPVRGRLVRCADAVVVRLRSARLLLGRIRADETALSTATRRRRRFTAL